MSDNKIYVGQHVAFTLNAKIALDDATTLEIRYFKPGETSPVTGLTASAAGFKAAVTLTPTILDTAGAWRFYIYAEIGGKTYTGETFKYDVTALGL